MIFFFWGGEGEGEGGVAGTTGNSFGAVRET